MSIIKNITYNNEKHDIGVSWDNVSDKPQTFQPGIHHHSIDDVENLRTSLAACLPLSGGIMTGDLLFKNGDFSFKSKPGNFDVGFDWDNMKGAGAAFRGSDWTYDANEQGAFLIYARNGAGTTTQLVGKPNGSLTWNGKEVERVESQGNNYIRYTNGFIVQWGYEDLSKHENRLVTFPTPFSSMNYQVTCSGRTKSTNTSSGVTSHYCQSNSNTNFYLCHDYTSNESPYGANWIACGF